MRTVLVLVLVLMAGCARPADLARPGTRLTPAPTGTPTSAAPVPGGCSSGGVALTATGVDGALGLRAMGVVIRNCGDGVVVLHGYPAARLADADHAPIDVTVTDGVTNTIETWPADPPTVTLHPGESAETVLVWRNITTSDRPATGAYLDLATADGEPYAPVALDQSIDLGDTGVLAVGAWRAHATIGGGEGE